jgi:hypothetical protein
MHALILLGVFCDLTGFVMMAFPWRESNPENNFLRNIPGPASVLVPFAELLRKLAGQLLRHAICASFVRNLCHSAHSHKYGKVSYKYMPITP